MKVTTYGMLCVRSEVSILRVYKVMYVIFVNRFWMLQIVSESDTNQCVNEEAEPREEVDMRRCASKNVGSRRGWIGRSHIDERRERVSSRRLGARAEI